VVHPMPARSTGRAPLSPRPDMSVGDVLRAERPVPMPYVFIPDPLIVAFAHDLLSVGVYVAIARLAMVAKTAVPLAARDLAAWMGSDRDADRAAIMRRIVKLEAGGWVIIERTTASKHQLLPTWGRDQAGQARPWRFDTADSGRPSHLRGRRVPLALFDDYLGRLDPQAGQGAALVSRYFTQPLLDLTDIGAYTIGLRAEIIPTPRLRHLGLHSAIGMLPPLDGRSLLEQAAAGTLTTLVGDVKVSVLPSIQGHVRLGTEMPIALRHDQLYGEYVCGSIRRSSDGSIDGSRDAASESPVLPHQDGQNASEYAVAPLIAWDVGSLHESTNHDSTPDQELVGGGSVAISLEAFKATSDQPAQVQTTDDSFPSRLIDDEFAEIAPSLTVSVALGHRALNPTRSIPPGEWHELLALQDVLGEAQLLIWQARASRASTERPYGITPAYYQACAAQAACEAYRPTTTWGASAFTDPGTASTLSSVPALPDPACNALLQAMGVRERQKLGTVSYDLIAAWQTALTHPGITARFTSPVGFAVAQMQRGNMPPPVAELERWAEQARRKDDRYEIWRYLDAPSEAAPEIAYEQHLESRVRAIAPPDADLADLCELARCIELGASDAEALASLYTRYAGGRA
jgi:hypothetical protein